MKEEPGITVSQGLADRFLDSFARFPPAIRVVFAVLDRDDSNVHFSLESLFKQQPAPASVWPECDKIKGVHRLMVGFEPLLQRRGRGECAVTIFDRRRRRPHKLRFQTQPLQSRGGIGSQVITGFDVRSAEDFTTDSHNESVVSRMKLGNAFLQRIIRKPALYHKQVGLCRTRDGKKRMNRIKKSNACDPQESKKNQPATDGQAPRFFSTEQATKR